MFRPSDGASAHCQSDNLRLSAQVTYDWLDDELGGHARLTPGSAARVDAAAVRVGQGRRQGGRAGRR